MEGHAQQQADASAVEAIQPQPVEAIATAEIEPAAPAPAAPRPDALTSALAGLQAGMLGVMWMLVWLGLSATWQNRSFWTAENLMATAFYGGAAIRPAFTRETFAGLALYLMIYSLLGALLAGVVRDRLARSRAILLSVVFALSWYYLSFRLIWKSVLPLVFLLHATQATVLGHLVYGVVLGRYPLYLHSRSQPAQNVADSEPVTAEPGPVG